MRKPILRLAVAAILAGAAGVSARQTATLESPRGSFAFRQQAASEVFRVVAQTMQVELQVDPRLTSKVSLELNNVSLRALLNALCESLGCRWRVEAAMLIVDRDEARQVEKTDDARGRQYVDAVNTILSVQLTDEPLRSAVAAVAKTSGTGCRVDVPKDYPDGPVNASIRNVPFLQALRLVFRTATHEKVELAVTGSLAPGTGTPVNCVIVPIKKPE
jgi:hypothetical protein